MTDYILDIEEVKGSGFSRLDEVEAKLETFTSKDMTVH